MKAKFILNESIEIIYEDWGTLQWLVSGKAGTSESQTVGRVTFKPGKSNPLHYHPNCDEVLCLISGQLEHVLDGTQTVKMAAGDAIAIPQGMKHNAKNIGNCETVAIISFNNSDRQTIGEEEYK